MSGARVLKMRSGRSSIRRLSDSERMADTLLEISRLVRDGVVQSFSISGASYDGSHIQVLYAKDGADLVRMLGDLCLVRESVLGEIRDSSEPED